MNTTGKSVSSSFNLFALRYINEITFKLIQSLLVDRVLSMWLIRNIKDHFISFTLTYLSFIYLVIHI